MVNLSEGFNTFTPFSDFDLNAIKSNISKVYCILNNELKVFDSSLSTNFALTQIPANTPAIIIAKNQIDNLEGSVGEVLASSNFELNFNSSGGNYIDGTFLNDFLNSYEGGSITVNSSQTINNLTISYDGAYFSFTDGNSTILVHRDDTLYINGNQLNFSYGDDNIVNFSVTEY